MIHLVMIDWAGPCPFGEQALVLRNIAALYLKRQEKYGKKVDFTHLLVEGRLSFRGATSFGSYSGNRFFADFGTHNDVPWYCEFLLPVSAEHIDIALNESILFGTSRKAGGWTVSEIDIEQSIATHDNIHSSE
jgi:hypothetical protein